MKTLLKTGIAFALFAVAFSAPGAASAATDLHVSAAPAASSTADLGTSDNPYASIDAAMAAAVDGDSILIDGTVVTTTSVTVNKVVTIKSGTAGRIETSGSNNVFTITSAGVTVDGLQIAKTDVGTVTGLIGIQANDVTVSNNTFTGQWVIGAGEVVRGLEISTVTNFNVTGNTFSGLRQPAYINDNAQGTVSNNSVSGTKGWVVVANSHVTFTGNTFSGNVVDIAFIPGTPNNYTDINAISAANNNAVVENQAFPTPMLSQVFVDASVATTGNGLKGSPYKTISEAFARVIDGGTITVAAGAYSESLSVTKPVTIVGPNASVSGTGSRAAEAVITGQVFINASSTSFKGFTVTNPSYSGATIKGVHVYGDSAVLTNITVSNNIITAIHNGNTKGAYGIMVQGVVDGVTIDGNKIDSIVSSGWARGIEVTPTGGSTTVPQHVTITNNSIMGVSSATGDQYDLSSDWSDSNSVVADASQVTFQRNILNGFKVKNLDTAHALNVTNNFWGSTTPEFFATSTATGTISYKPWYMDAGLTTLYTDPVVTPAPITVTSSDYAPQSGASGGGSGGGSSGGFTTSVANTTSNGVTTTTTSTGTTGQVLGISTYNFASDLHIGMRSNDVLELQKRLAAEGFFAVNPTGYFGTITRFSAKIYQATHRIQPLSGFVGPLTRAELNK
jgi:hypothetical protein